MILPLLRDWREDVGDSHIFSNPSGGRGRGAPNNEPGNKLGADVVGSLWRFASVP